MHDLTVPSPHRNPTYLVWLWGPDHGLSCAGVAAVADAPATLLAPGLAHVATADPTPLHHFGYARALLGCLGRTALSDFAPPFDPNITIRGTFCVRVHRLGVADVIPSADVARQVWRRVRGPRADLVHPDTEIHVFATPTGFWWGVLLHAVDQAAFDARRPRDRPFWRSTALAPRRARCLVNLSGIRPGAALLDPFCGTGSILIEAALVGARPHGSEIDETVCAGAVRNLAHYGLHADLRRQDARHWRTAGIRFDAIVSDLPYGHSASLKGSDRDDLYRTFLEVAAEILNPHGRMVLMCRYGTLPGPPSDLALVERFQEVVYGSLNREILVLRKNRR